MPNDLSTLAAAYAESGDFAQAVSWQEKAITALTDETAKEVFRQRLELYRNRQPYRNDK